VILGVNAAAAAGRRIAGDDEPLVADYLEFLAGRARPNSVLAAGYDLRVFFSVVGGAAGVADPA
jgi:hypothetical protein